MTPGSNGIAGTEPGLQEVLALRFEGYTSPDDQDIVFPIRCDCGRTYNAANRPGSPPNNSLHSLVDVPALALLSPTNIVCYVAGAKDTMRARRVTGWTTFAANGLLAPRRDGRRQASPTAMRVG